MISTPLLARRPQLRICLVAGAVIAMVSSLSGGTARASVPGVTCRTYTGIPVALAAGTPAGYTVSGELCATPAELARGETVQLLVHGATYNDSYWDFGTVDGVTYSYARDVAAAGFPAFAMDEIGAGTSSHPLSTDITVQATAYVEHEVLQDLLAGSVGGVRFGKVIIVAHSLGSATTWQETATYHDAAGVILTGAAHSPAAYDTMALGDFYQATLDPKFSASGLDAGYQTTEPGTREALFYNSSDADPNVIAKDEATKDVVSGTYLDSGLGLITTTVSLGINVPVLLILGGKDQFFCGPSITGGTFSCSSGQEVATEEAPYYSPQAQLRACVVPGSGHDINLALNHDLEEADALAWSREYVGQEGVPAIRARVLPPDCSR